MTLPGIEHLPETVAARIDVDPATSCWTWRGHLTEKGYGRLWWDGRTRIAHRLVFELLSGPIGDGLDLDHLCAVRSCVRPSHLQPVEHSLNVDRRQQGPRCPHGEGWTSAGGWTCRACRNAPPVPARAAPLTEPSWHQLDLFDEGDDGELDD